MKTHKVLFLALLVSALLAVSVEAGDRRGNNNGRSQVAPSRGHSSNQSFSSGSGFRSGGGRMIGSAPRFSSMGPRSMPSSFRQRSTFNSGGNVASFSQRQFTPRTFNRSNAVGRFQNNGNFGTIQNNRVNRFSSLNNTERGLNRPGGTDRSRFGNNNDLGTVQANRVNRFGNNRSLGAIQGGNPGGRVNNRGFNGAGANQHVFAQRSANWHRDWDRHSDHWWNGHRCRWVNNSWFIFDFGFVPWYGWSYYDYYPYDSYYSYYPSGYGAYSYDPGVYDQSNYYDQGGYSYNDQSNYYDQGGNRSSSYDESTAAMVADLQDKLARGGYYHGQIDGVLGPETRHAQTLIALIAYQRVTGSLTTETQQSLGLAQGGDQITDQ